MKRHPVAICLVGLLLISGGGIRADEIVRSSGNGPLNLTTAWVDGVVPGSNDIAVWQAGANQGSTSLGADLSWAGIKVLDPGFLNTSGANTLTLGAAGIDMSGASNDATLSFNYHLAASQTWRVASGFTLNVGGAAISGGASELLTFSGPGSIFMSSANDQTYSGGTLLENDVTVYMGNNNGGGNFGTGTLTIKDNVALAAHQSGGRTLNTATVFTGSANTLTLGTASISGQFIVTEGFDLGTAQRTVRLLNLDPASTSNVALTIGGTTSAGTGGSLVLSNGNASPATQPVWVKIGTGAGTGIVNGNVTIGENVEAYLGSSDSLGVGAEMTVDGILDISLKTNSAVQPTIKTLSGSGVVTSGRTNPNTHRLTIDGGASTATTDFSGVIQDGGVVGALVGVTKSGSSTQILSGNNSFTGGVIVNDGTLSLSGDNTAMTGLLTVNGGVLHLGSDRALGSGINGVTFGASAPVGTKLQLDGHNTTIGAVTSNATPGSPVIENGGSNDATLTVNNTTNTTFAGVIQNGGAGKLNLVKTGTAGTWTLTGVNTYTGFTHVLGPTTLTLLDAGTANASSGYTVTEGTLTASNTGTVTANRLGAVAMTLQGGAFNFVGKSTFSTSETIGNLILDSGANRVTITGQSASNSTVVNSNELVRNNNSVLLVRGNFLGSAATNSGLLKFASAPSVVGGGGAISTSTTKNVSIIPYLVGDSSGGAGTQFVGWDATNGVRALSTNQYVLFNAATANLGTAGANDNVKLTSAETAVSVTGSPVNSAIFHLATAPSAVTYTLNGTLTPNSGAMLFSRAGTAQAVTLAAGTGALLQFAGSDSSTSRREGIISNTGGADVALNVQIAGSGGLTLSTYNAGSSITLGSTANNYSGVTTVNGLVNLGAAGVIPNASGVLVGQGGIFNLNGFSETIDALNGTGAVDSTVASSSQTLTVGHSGGSGSFAGVIGNSGAGSTVALTKTGTGSQTLSGVNTFTGTTTVNAGTLIVSSSGQLSNSAGVSVGASGAFVYNNNTAAYGGNVVVDGTLGGSGKIAGSIGGSGQVGPGNSPGILTAGQADPSGGLDFAFEFSATGAPNYGNNTASVNDVLRLTDGTTPFTGILDSNNEIKIYLNVASLSANDTFYGGFYTDLGTDFLSTIADATFSYYLFNASGAVTYNGVNYDVYSGPFTFEVNTVAQMANFGGGDINGYVTQFTAVPEPGTTLLVGLGLVGVLYGFRRSRT